MSRRPAATATQAAATKAEAAADALLVWREARRRDGVLVDPDSVQIHDAIDYDFAHHFGDPAGSLAARAAAIDRALRQWLERHPDEFVVSLGEGLEKQCRRVDNG